MTDLIISGGVETMSSLEIAILVESRHDSVKRTIERLASSGVIPKPPMVDGISGGNGKVTKLFCVDKRSSYIIVAQLSPQFTARLVDRWQELESKVPALPQDLPTALRLYADQLEITASQEKLIAEQKPKALFADAVTSSASSILVGELAKLICQNGVKIGQNRLFVWLRDNGYLVRQRGENFNLPTQRSMDRGWFEIKVTTIDNRDGSKRRTSTTKVTGKGQVYFVNKFLGEVV